jgi:uncharacterized surface protein with fasciclin (FAS1) repeats
MSIKSILAATAFALIALPALADNPMVGGAAMYADKNIVENAVNSADLVETLQGAGPFTVFAPTNEAFAALPAGTVETLLMPENLATLQKVLTCHVVAANAMSADAMSMIEADGGSHVVDTVGGCKLTLAMDGDMLTVTDEQGGVATVTIADVVQSNGVIHVVDKVLLPAM